MGKAADAIAGTVRLLAGSRLGRFV